MELYEVKAMLTANVGDFMDGLGRAMKALSDFQSSAGDLGSISSTLTKVGAGMTLGLTVPLVGMGAVGVKQFADFDSNLRKTMAAMGEYADENGNFTGESAKNYETLSKKAKEWGQESIYSSTEVAGAMEELAARGLDTNGILEATPGVINLAAATGMKGADGIERAANAVGSAMQQFNSQGLESTHVADVFAQAAADTALQGNDLANALKYVGTTAASNNLSFEETAAALGVMSDSGLRAEQSGRYLNMAISKMANPTKEARKIMDELGISFYDSEGNMKSLSENTAMLREKFAGLTDEERQYALATLFGQEAGRGMNALLGETSGKLEVLTDNFINSEGAAEKMSNTINSGVSGAMEKMAEAISNAFLTIGEILAPKIIEIAQWIEKLVEKFNSLDPATQEMIVSFGMLVAAIGPLVTLFGIFLDPIIKLAGGFATLIGFLIANPWIIFAAAAVAAVVLIVKNWEGISEFFSNLWETLKSSASEVWESIKTKFSEGAEKLKENWEQIKENAIKANEELKAKLETVWNAIKSAIETVWNGIKTVTSTIWNGIKSTIETIWNGIKSVVETVFNAIKDVISKAWDAVKTKSQEIWNSIKSTVETIWNNIKTAATTAFNAIKDVISKAWDNVKKKTDEIWNQLKEAISKAVDNIKKAVSTGWQNLVATVTTKGTEIVNAVKKAWSNAIQGAKEFVSDAIQAGKDLIGGFITGIGQKAGELVSKAKGVVGDAISGAKNLLGIRSPSRVFKDMAHDTMDGYIIGIGDRARETVNAIGDLIGSVIGEANKGEFDFTNRLSNLNGAINGSVEHSIRNNNAMNKPADITLKLGNRAYRAFVEDISNTQGQEAELVEAYGY